MNKPSKLIRSVPYESSVSVTKPILVGVCKSCFKEFPEGSVYDPYGEDKTCYNEHEWEWWAQYKYGGGHTRGLHKRLMWKCPKCDGYYFTRAELLDHDHWYI